VVNNNQHPANLTGTFCCNSLGGVFVVHRGTFQLFNQDPRQPDTANLTYNFDMVSPSGKKLHFNGYKVVNTAAFLNPSEVWKQTTTLYVTISDVQTSEVVGRGSLYIQPADFRNELETFQTVGSSLWAKISSATSFATFFAKQLSVPFFSTLGRLQWPGGTIDDGASQVTPPAQTIPLEASDGVRTTLLMWEPTNKNDGIVSAPKGTLLFIPGAAVDHTIFALPTIPKNAITYFREAGYKVYCLTHRVGRTAVAREGHTPFDARLDIRAALAHIRKVSLAQTPGEPQQKTYIVAHCAGSLALACGLLDGTIPADWVRGATCSMVFMNPKFGKINHIASAFPVSIYSKLISPWYDCSSSKNDTFIQQIINQALRFYPVGSARETCRSVVCHRSDLVFGR
jgi:hypothetical protein